MPSSSRLREHGASSVLASLATALLFACLMAAGSVQALASGQQDEPGQLPQPAALCGYAANDAASSDEGGSANEPAASSQTLYATQSKTQAAALVLQAADGSYTGTIGQGCSWTLDANGNLTIYPTDGASGTMDCVSDIDLASSDGASITGKTKTITVKPGVKAPQDTRYLFGGMYDAKTIDVSALDTSSVTNMDSWFSGCYDLEALDLSSFDTSKVTNMSDLLFNDEKLISVDLSSFATANADVSNMFYNCDNLTSVTLGENFSFKGTTRWGEACSCALPDPTVWGYKGVWISPADGSGWTTSQLTESYDGTTMAGTWTASREGRTDLSQASVSVENVLRTQSWEGPSPKTTVTLNGTVLTAATDYSSGDYDVTFDDDPQAFGTHTLTISGSHDGAYTGSLSATYVVYDRSTLTLSHRNKAHYDQLRSTVTLDTYAAQQNAAAFDYVRDLYQSTPRGLRVDGVDATDRARLQSLADRICEGCSTDSQRAVAIARWTNQNLTYGAWSSYPATVMYDRSGVCFGRSQLFAALCRLEGMPAAVVSGYKVNNRDRLAAYTMSSVESLATDPSEGGHAWCYVYTDGHWTMYDELWGYYSVDVQEITNHGYFATDVEGITVIGENVDPVLASKSEGALVYEGGKIVQLAYGVPVGDATDQYYVDANGNFAAYYSSYSNTRFWQGVNDRSYPALRSSTGTYDLANGDGITTATETRYYLNDDGTKSTRPAPGQGEVFTDGWIAQDDETLGVRKLAYAGEDGILLVNTVQQIGGTWYLFNDDGEPTAITEDEARNLYLKDGTVTLQPGQSTKCLLPDSMLRYLEIDGYTLEAGNGGSDSTDLVDNGTASVDPDGTVHALKEGEGSFFASIIRNEDGARQTIDILSLIVSNGRPEMDYGTLPGTLPDISGATVTVAVDELYDSGRAQEPAVTVTYEGKVLAEGQDYTLSYTNNDRPGTATVTVTGKFTCTGIATATFTIKPIPEGCNAMYRLYNPWSGEHFYTADASERDGVVAAGWNDEGVGWIAPQTGSDVYRLYNAYGGEHHYTLDAAERDGLIAAGWNDEGVGWLSADADSANSVPLYREYNPYAFANNHNYTTSKSENDFLVSIGWQAEGIGWYGVNG